MRKHIPNILTCLNLLSGAFGVCLLLSVGNGSESALVQCVENSNVRLETLVFLCVACSAVFDFLDGFVARLLGVSSPIGKELDSLADLVSFGMLPTAMAFTMVSTHLSTMEMNFNLKVLIECLCWIMLAFSALRLAKFNVDTRQTTSFIGLATPANALMWLGLFCSGVWMSLPWWVMFVLIFVCSFLLVSELPMFSFKIHSLRWAEAKYQILLVMGAVSLLLSCGFAGLSLTIIWYIFLSLLKLGLEKK